MYINSNEIIGRSYVSNLHEIKLSIINNLVSEAVPIRNKGYDQRGVTCKAKKKRSRNTNPVF